MIKKIFQYSSIGFIGLLSLLMIALLVFSIYTSIHLKKTYSIQVEKIAIPSDATAVARGQHIVESRGCTDCHGANMEGKVFIDDFPLGKVVATNLTGGKGGVQNINSDDDWARAIRHGVHRSGRPLVIMPSNEYNYMSDDDLGSVIAYLKQVPPVDNELPENNIGPLAKVLYPLGKLDQLLPVELIDHTANRPTAPVAEVSAEYGKYISVSCQGCHYSNMEGGPSSVPGFPPAPSLTRNGNLAHWTEADFIRALRSGKTVDGKELNNAYMPWQNFGKMNDTELRAIWAYFQTLPQNKVRLASGTAEKE